MNLYMIAQYLSLDGPQEDRLLKVGRECQKKGHDVTVFTINRVQNFYLGRKKIGLIHKAGLKIITFNVALEKEMGAFKKAYSFLKFAWMTGRQGKMLPRPDLILAVSPPLTATLPALSLSKHYGVPLVAEIRELWPDGPLERGTMRNGLMVKTARRLEQRLYEKAGRIVACRDDIAGKIKERWVEQAKVSVIEEGLSEDQVVEQYEQVFKGIVKKDKLLN